MLLFTILDITEPSLFPILLNIIGTTIVILLGIVGFFIKKFGDQVEILTKVMHDLQISVSTERVRSEADKKTNDIEHTHLKDSIKINELRIEDTNKRMDDHGKKISEIDLTISMIKNDKRSC